MVKVDLLCSFIKKYVLPKGVKVLILSATLPETLMNFFDNALVTLEDYGWEVEPEYSQNPVKKKFIVDAAVKKVMEIHEWLWRQSGDCGGILVFLPDLNFINQAKKELAKKFTELGEEVDLRRAASSITEAEWKTVNKSPELGKRVIVLSTDILESSKTLPWLTVVVDSGLAKRVVVKTKVTCKEVIRISRKRMKQRWGRINRTHRGWAFCLYTKAEYEEEASTVPAYLESDYDDLVFQMIALRLNPLDLPEQLNVEELQKSMQQLRQKAVVTTSDDNRPVLTSTCGASVKHMPIENVDFAILLDQAWQVGFLEEAIALYCLAEYKVFYERGPASQDSESGKRVMTGDYEIYKISKISIWADEIKGWLESQENTAFGRSGKTS